MCSASVESYVESHASMHVYVEPPIAPTPIVQHSSCLPVVRVSLGIPSRCLVQYMEMLPLPAINGAQRRCQIVAARHARFFQECQGIPAELDVLIRGIRVDASCPSSLP